MRTLSALLLFASTGLAIADDKPARWEYAELTVRPTPARPAVKDKDGNEQPATPAGVAIRWTTGAEEVALKGWDELTEKLKAQIKKDAPASQQRVRALDALGAAGWEVVSQETTSPATGPGTGSSGGFGGGGFGGGGFGGSPSRLSTTTLLFKRRVP